MKTDKHKALVICFIGILLAAVILGSLMAAYIHTEEDPKINKTIDIVGIITIIISSVIYWLVFTRVWCISYNLASIWPRLAFRYALGGGLFFGLFQMLVKGNKQNDKEQTLFESFEDYYPLLVLAFIFGNYCFIFMEIASMDNHNCLIKIRDL